MKTIVLHTRGEIKKYEKNAILKSGVIFTPIKKSVVNTPTNQAPLESGTKKNKEGTAEVLHISPTSGFERF